MAAIKITTTPIPEFYKGIHDAVDFNIIFSNRMSLTPFLMKVFEGNKLFRGKAN